MELVETSRWRVGPTAVIQNLLPSTMRFRPASINYLVDASSHHTYHKTLPNVLVQKVKEKDRREEENEEENERFELRSVHSSDFDGDFPYDTDADDDGETTVDLVSFSYMDHITCTLVLIHSHNPFCLPPCSMLAFAHNIVT